MFVKKRTKLLILFAVIITFILSLKVHASPNQPDSRPVGYVYLDNGKVIHFWNQEDDYYLNTSSGIQFSNYYQNYFTRNIFCGGAKINNEWRYYCNDALPFMLNIATDNSTYINITAYNDTIIQNRNLRMLMRYSLKRTDTNLTILGLLKNTGNLSIPVDLGFGWLVKDIKIDGDSDDDNLKVSIDSSYLLNQILDINYTNASGYKIFDNNSVNFYWNNGLNHKLWVRNKQASQNKALLALLINIGSLNAGQEKQTIFYWNDPPLCTNCGGEGGGGTTTTILPTFNLTYDKNGNLVKGFGKYYEYNGFNQLIRIRKNNSTGKAIEEYLYDHEGNRIRKIDVGITSNTSTYYIGRNLVRIINASGSYDEVYYYADNTLVAMKDASGNKRFYHPDHLGSTNLVTDINGNAVENTTYLPYGDIFSGGNSRYDYTSKELDLSKLYYYGARYYDANFTRFIQPDFVIQDVYNPQDLNHYAYVRNNPYKYVDLDGRKVYLVTRPLQGPLGCCFTHSYFDVTPDNPEDFGGIENFQLGAYSSTGGPRGNLISIENYEDDLSKAISREEVQNSMSDTELINAIKVEGEILNKANIPYAPGPGLFGPTSGENSNVFVRTAIENTGSNLPEDVSYGELGGLRPSPGIKRTIDYNRYSERSRDKESQAKLTFRERVRNLFTRSNKEDTKV